MDEGAGAGAATVGLAEEGDFRSFNEPLAGPGPPGPAEIGLPVSARVGSGILMGAVPISGEGILPDPEVEVEDGCTSTIVGMGTESEFPVGVFEGMGAGAVLRAAGLIGGEVEDVVPGPAPGKELGAVLAVIDGCVGGGGIFCAVESDDFPVCPGRDGESMPESSVACVTPKLRLSARLRSSALGWNAWPMVPGL